MNKENIKKWFFRIKIFINYLLTEPFRAIRGFMKLGKKQALELTKQKTWLWIYTGIVIFLLFTDNDYMKYAFLVILLFMIIRYEWQKGDFVNRYREKQKKEIEKQNVGESPLQ